MHSKIIRIMVCSVLGVLAGQAYAHTGVRDAADEGKASYNGFVITHGCNNAAEGTYEEQYPVLGQGAVFPMMANAVWKTLKDPTKAAGPANLQITATGGDGGVLVKGTQLSLGVTGFAGNASVFETTQELVDELGNVHGLMYMNGAMEPKLNAITDFKVTVPAIANDCVKSLKVRIAVINWCDRGKNAANDASGPYKAPRDMNGRKIYRITGSDNGGKQRNIRAQAGLPPVKFYEDMPAGNGDNNRADWWFSALEGGSNLYNDPDILQPSYWTTLTVNNSATDIAKCSGTPYDVYVEPNGADVDKYLSGANTAPFTSGSSGF